MYPAYWILALAFGLLSCDTHVAHPQGKVTGPRPKSLLIWDLGCGTLRLIDAPIIIQEEK
jgi:hypothetical protein